MNTRRARKLIRKRRRLENSKLLGFAAHRITDKSLWIANYDTVARGVFVGFLDDDSFAPANDSCSYFSYNFES
ncbi:hypothetical protein [Francisella salimarina]|uniref:hypothetical protein n=1 Tax=Francisella salimarina TaxID=2599927 RepID=UPI003D81342F